jgi:hypothetical protein
MMDSVPFFIFFPGKGSLRGQPDGERKGLCLPRRQRTEQDYSSRPTFSFCTQSVVNALESEDGSISQHRGW